MTRYEWNNLKPGDYVMSHGIVFNNEILQVTENVLTDKRGCSYIYVFDKDIQREVRIGNHKIWTKLTDSNKIKLL